MTVPVDAHRMPRGKGDAKDSSTKKEKKKSLPDHLELQKTSIVCTSDRNYHVREGGGARLLKNACMHARVRPCI